MGPVIFPGEYFLLLSFVLLHIFDILRSLLLSGVFRSAERSQIVPVRDQTESALPTRESSFCKSLFTRARSVPRSGTGLATISSREYAFLMVSTKSMCKRKSGSGDEIGWAVSTSTHAQITRSCLGPDRSWYWSNLGPERFQHWRRSKTSDRTGPDRLSGAIFEPDPAPYKLRLRIVYSYSSKAKRG